MTAAPTSIAAVGATAPFPWLVADIGGTNARFGWVEREDTAVEHIASLRVAEHDGPVAAARAYLSQLAPLLGPRFCSPRSGAWALATALRGDHVDLTNAGWSFSQHEAQDALGLHTLLLLNDFEALALSLPRLAPAQLRRVAETAAQAAVAGAARAVIGPGTGLGVAGLLPCPAARGLPARWLALPGEGGHASLAAADDFEAEVLAFVRRRYAHVSAERLLSGIGLPLLHEAVAAVQGRPAAALTTQAIVAAGVACAEAVTAVGSAGTTGAMGAAAAAGMTCATGTAGTTSNAGADAQCRETLQHFCALLGGFAGNVALTMGARGGVYLGGGIVPRLGELFLRSRFRERFEAKGRFEAYLAAIPTWLIVDTHAALAGAALALQQR